jgi:hypothetical protein
MKSARKARARRKVSRRTAPLSLSARVERLEKTLLFKAPAAQQSAGPRFTKLAADGTEWMDAQDGEHVATYDRQTGLTWSAAPLEGGKDMDHATAMKACASLDLLRHKDWRAPTIQELLSIVDYERFDPAVNTEFFKGPYGWTWSSTIAKSPSVYAWYVSLYDGYSLRYLQSIHARVRAVRAGQALSLGL